MSADSSLKPSNASTALIRLRQLQAIDQLLPTMMVANVICAGSLAALLFNEAPLALLLWFAAVTAASLFRLRQAQQSNAAISPQGVSKPQIHLVVAQSGAMALCYTSVPVWLLTQTSGTAFTIIICLMTGILWAGGLVLSTVPAAAVAYVGVCVMMNVFALLASGGNELHLFLASLFVVGGCTVLQSAFRQSKLFLASQHQQIDIKAQSDLVGLLLKDYEEQTSDWLWETDAELRYANVSGRFAQALGRSSRDIEGVPFGSLLSSELPGNAESRLALREHAEARRPFRDAVIAFTIDEEPRWWILSGRPIFDDGGNFVGYRGVSADITTSKRAESRIAYLAHHDPLTELPNRTLLTINLDRALANIAEKEVAVLSLDLDGFKAVNDRYGHPAGDALLAQVAKRLLAQVNGNDVVARLGGDEFVILVTNFSDMSEIERLSKQLIGALVKPFTIGAEDVTIGVSIGIAFAPSDGRTSEDLLKSVDAALYRAKLEGRGTFRFFAPEMDGALQIRRRMVQDLRSALYRKQFVLHYQPFVKATTGQVTGCEALLRWHHPEKGMVSPNDFIPLAEESGLIVDIGNWVIEEACREAASWTNTHRVSVNVSPLQFRRRGLPEVILAALVASGLAPDRLEIEITEAVLISDADAALDILRRIRNLGVSVALDDFGTGYSSLGYLRAFPFDKIKIDQSFVRELPTRRDNQVIVQAIYDIAQGLGMTITAEGVETAEQAAQLRLTGCQELQGYYFSRPKPAGELNPSQGLASSVATPSKAGMESAA